MAQQMLLKFKKKPELPGAELLQILKMKSENGEAIIGRGIIWSREEREKLIDAIRNHGRDWQIIVPMIPSRNRAQICAMAQCLMLKFEKKPHLPGADILPILKDKKHTKNAWTNEETQKLIDGLKKYGKDFKKLSEYIESRDYLQVRYQVNAMKKKSTE